MKKYNSYKDSQGELIDRVPKHWNKIRLKDVCEIENSGTWGNDEFFEGSIKVPVPTTGQLSIEGVWNYNKMENRFLGHEEWKYYKCIEGDIIVVKSSGSSTNIITGKCGFISKDDDSKFSFSNFLLRVRPLSVVPKFVYYFLSSNLTKQRIERMVSSTTYPNLKVDEYRKSTLFLPPESEQIQIVTFLDSKIGKVDELLKKKEDKIKLLKEKRTSIISHTLTKGLNSSVKFKDSTIEWIGEIPLHWRLIKLKQLFHIKKRISGELGYDVLSVTQKGLKVKDLDSNKGQHSMDYTKYQMVYEGDFVMNHMDLLTGFVDLSSQTGVTSPDYRVFTKVKDDVENRFYLYLFQLCYTRRVFYGLGRGVSNMGRWRLPSVEFLNFYIPYPSVDEQQQVVNFLDNETKKIDDLIELEYKKINRLKEFRLSLITEVVTGKVRVCEEDHSENLEPQIV